MRVEQGTTLWDQRQEFSESCIYLAENSLFSSNPYDPASHELPHSTPINNSNGFNFVQWDLNPIVEMVCYRMTFMQLLH